MKIKLARPSIEQEKEALAFKKEFFDAGERVINGSEMLDYMEGYCDWVAVVTANADPERYNKQWVLADTYFALDETDRIVGIIDFRHELKGFLKDFGHCGYSVRPSERRKGYAKQMLSLIIERARECGFTSLQLSVEKENLPSVKTIIANGGVYDRSFINEDEAGDVYIIKL